MSRILKHKKWVDMIFICGILLMLYALLLLPEVSVSAARDGIELCLNVIIPSLFPFFVLSTLAVDMGMISALGKLTEKIMRPLFRVNGSCAGAFLLGILGGYPVGARTAISLYESGSCTKTEAERLLSFCNNSGPAFILGVVGAGIFSSSKAGIWLYLAHVTASVVVGILFRSYGGKEESRQITHIMSTEYRPFSQAFPDAVKNAFSGTGNICAFVIFFTVVIRLLFQTGILPFISSVFTRFGLDVSVVESLVTGLIEMTSGVWSLRDMAGDMGDKLSMAAFILGWAGLSVHCQVLSFIGTSGLSTRTYFFGKLSHGILSGILVWLLSSLMNWDTPVSAHLAQEVSTIANLSFPQTIMVSLTTVLGIFAILCIISVYIYRKECGKTEHNHV